MTGGKIAVDIRIYGDLAPGRLLGDEVQHLGDHVSDRHGG